MKSGFTLLFLLSSCIAFSQDSSFQLKDYKYRTPGYKALAVNFNLSGGFSDYNVPLGDKANSHTLSLGPVAAWYSKFISTDARQHQSMLSLSSQYSSSGNTYNQNKSSNKNFIPAFSWSVNDRFYRGNNWFFELGNSFNASAVTHRSQDTFQRYKNNGTDLFDQVTLGLGKGRVELVQDAQMALFLLQDLASEGLLSRPPSADEAYQLARLITDINNQRVFDFRRRRKYELTRLDSFFRSSGLAPQTDIRHFTVINDNWSLSFNPARLSGANWYIRVQPGIRYSRTTNHAQTSSTLYDSKSKSTLFTVSPVVGYEAYRPLSLQWQRNMGISFSFARYNSNREDEWTSPGMPGKTSIDTSAWQSVAHAFYGVGYYPNNRTQLNAVLDLSGNYDKAHQFSMLSTFSLNVQYFISYRTFLSASVNARHNLGTLEVNGKKESAHDFFSDFAVSLSHVLF
jgi:hypothetical protein